MLSLIPPLIAITVLMSVAVLTLRTAEETSMSTELARDLIRHHEAGRREASRDGFPEGPVEVRIPPPFLPVGSWSTEVIPDGDGVAVLTWAFGYGTDRVPVPAYDGVTAHLPASRSGFAGLIRDDDGARFLGATPLPDDLSLPAVPGAPALLTRVGG